MKKKIEKRQWTDDECTTFIDYMEEKGYNINTQFEEFNNYIDGVVAEYFEIFKHMPQSYRATMLGHHWKCVIPISIALDSDND